MKVDDVVQSIFKAPPPPFIFMAIVVLDVLFFKYSLPLVFGVSITPFQLFYIHKFLGI